VSEFEFREKTMRQNVMKVCNVIKRIQKCETMKNPRWEECEIVIVERF
jgi:hypothetical protein